MSGAASLAISVVGLCIALYATILSRRALAWQQRRDMEQRETRVRIDFEHSAEYVGLVSVANRSSPPTPLSYVIALIATNEGEATEYVTWCSVEEAEGDRLYDLTDNLGGDHELRPRQRVGIKFDVDGCGFDLAQGFVGVVQLASGAEIRSEVESLQYFLREHIAEHNRSNGL